MHALEIAEHWYENDKNKTECETRNLLQLGDDTIASDRKLSLRWLVLDQAWTRDLCVFHWET